MADTRAHRRDRLAAGLLAALLALSVVAGAVGLGAAHGDTDHVERNGDQVEIRLGDEHDVTEATEISVVTEEGNSTVEEVENATDTFQIPVTKLSDKGTDLRSANVTVRVNGTELFTETADLRYLRFGDTTAEQVSFDGSDLRIQLAEALGYESGASVSTTFAGDEVTGTVAYDGGEPYLAVSLTASRVIDAPSDPITVTAGDRSTTVNVRSAVEDATSVSPLDDGTLLVTNPLVTSGSTYDLVVRTTNPDGTYASSIAANETGALVIAERSLATAGELNVSVYSGGNPLVENQIHGPDSATTNAANVTDNGSAVDVDDWSVTANETSVWLANSTRYVNASVPVEDGVVNLSATDYRLNENASYRLIVTGEENVRARIPGNDTADNYDNDSLTYAAAGDTPGDGGDGDSAEGGSDVIFGLSPVVLAGLGVAASLAFGGVAFVVFRSRGGRSRPPKRQADAAAATGGATRKRHEAEISIEDVATGSTVSAKVRATPKSNNAAFQNGSSRNEVTETLSNGKGSLTLDQGKWIVEAGSHGVSEQKRVNVRRDVRLQFELGPRRVTATVADDGGDPLSDVPVTCTPDQGRERESRTGGDGEVRFDVPLAADEVEVSADPDRYEGDAATVPVGAGDDAATLRLSPQTGGLDVTATVEGTPVAGLPVEVRPRGDVETLGASRRTASTGDDGVAGFDDLLVGEYEVGVAVPGGGDAFSVDSGRARVRDGRRARETLDAGFEFGLSRNQRDRITSVRQDVDALVSTSGGDAAIPRYYGSVVSELLDAVERLPREGHRFAGADADPDAVVDALLDAAERAVALVDDAMTTKRNTDLFGTCADMPDHRVDWRGGFDVEALFELLTADRKDQRQTVLTRLRTVDDRVNDERSELAVVSPAREPWEGVKEFVNEERGDDPVRGAAVAFAAGGLLDAVDELFDHEELRNRLERTVF